ncbi:MAG: WD40/YVTN/BNR-like repeat-containing protein [Rhodothalassiaceae bacterium]
MRTGRFTALSLSLLMIAAPIAAQEAAEQDSPPNPFTGLDFRLIGPSYPSGRISDFAVHPDGPHHYYIATASGGLWKTENAGTTWQPLFDKQPVYALGVVELDPTDPLVIWAGSGENNAQRSVAAGDGVYKSMDGGKTWTNVGLKDSGHISKIWINPADSDHVRVAAQGSLWSDGGDRGLYETQDGGETWNRLLEVDDFTGVNEFVVHPDDPDRIVASSYQRRRHVWTLINGGPGSGLHKSSDGGQTWQEISRGVPTGELGRIGLAQAPSEPATLYAIIEGKEADKGIYRSTDFGESWEKRSAHMTTSPQYYNELVVDPTDPDIVYSLDTFTHRSEDGGKSWQRLSADARHVDDHALWINPDNSDHLLIGGDGGVYESYDGGQVWRHMANLPIVQFYRIAVGPEAPFYTVCGGTQDNNSLCGPSQTTNHHGITNWDWHIILGGDGYKPAIDPEDPDTIYTQYQYGGLARYDRRTQERIYTRPQPASGENDFKWNWNTPILISPHDHKTIFYAAEKLFRSTDRASTWEAISPDLTRQLDRNALKVMGRVWSVDAIAKNDSTSIYGAAIALDESPIEQGLIYVGTDDGVISVTEDGGETWHSVQDFPGVPTMSLVEDIIASRHDAAIAYAVFDNHKRGDIAAYILKTTDKGRTWQPVDGVPDEGPVHTIAEDHEDPTLLFAGTELGLYFSQDGGAAWHEFTGLPTIAIRDLEIQRAESDLVVGTFGRGIYILDDYSPLRHDPARMAEAEATLFPVADAWLYIEGDLYGGRPGGSHGAAFWRGENPPFGAVVRYHLPEGFQSLKQQRQTAEAEKLNEGEDTPYPDWDRLREEALEDQPKLLLTIKDADGQVVRRLQGPAGKGLHQVAWNLRHDAPDPVSDRERPYWLGEPQGPLALPGEYSVELARQQGDEWVAIGEPQRFTVKPLNRSPEATEDRPSLLAFQQDTAALYRRVSETAQTLSNFQSRIDHMLLALERTPKAKEADYQTLRALHKDLAEVRRAVSGDRVVAAANEPVPVPIESRVNAIIRGHWGSQAPVIGVYKENYAIAHEELAQALTDLQDIHQRLTAMDKRLQELGAPATPDRLPAWTLE